MKSLFDQFDRGRLSRRLLLQSLGVAMVARPAMAFAQGSCGGARASLPECDPTPAKAPFAPTGWKTVWLDHFSMQVADYQKEAAYFAALMNWKIRSDDGTQALLDIGDNTGGMLIRGGYQAPAPPPQPAGQPGAARAGGRGGGNRAPRLVTFDGFCWGIDQWDTKKVEAELRARGLDPIADHRGKDFQSFHVKDPNGFDLQISNGNRKNRRAQPAAGKGAAPAPFESTAWKTVWLDHISFEVTDYKASVAFYAALLGWTPGKDEGSQNEVQIGDIGDAIIRRSGGGGGRGGAAGSASGGQTPAPAVKRAGIGHIAFGIDPWNADAVKAELDKRGLTGRPDTGGPTEIHVAKYQSYHTTSPNGFDLQISNARKATRGQI